MTIQEYFQYYKEKSMEFTYPNDNQELWDLHLKILSYCKFNINDLSRHLEILVSSIENKEYKVGVKKHKYNHPNIKIGINGPHVDFDDRICDTAYLYPIDISEDEINNDLYHLSENKISIINTTKNGGFNIEKGTFDVFYDDRSNDGYCCTVHHDKFPYLKNFFEELVNLRIEKQDINITDEEIKNIILEIIETNKLNSNKTR